MSPKAELPEPAVLLVLITTLLAVAFAALGGRLRARATAEAATPTEARDS